MAKRITAEDIHNLIQSKLAPAKTDEPKIANLLNYIGNPTRTMMSSSQPLQTKPNQMPAIPDVAGQQEMMGTNSIAQRYPGLGAR